MKDESPAFSGFSPASPALFPKIFQFLEMNILVLEKRNDKILHFPDENFSYLFQNDYQWQRRLFKKSPRKVRNSGKRNYSVTSVALKTGRVSKDTVGSQKLAGKQSYNNWGWKTYF